MRGVPILLKPRLFALKNRWFHRSGKHGKEYLSALASLCMAAAIYYSTWSALMDTSRMFGGASLDPSIPLNLILTTLFLMLTLSSSVAALGTLFLSKDLDLLLAAPLSRRAFVLGKVSEIALSSSWMLLVFALPSLFAFGTFYHGDAAFFLVAPILCAVLFILPALLSIPIAAAFGAVVPPNRGRDLFLVLFLVSLLAFIAFLGGPLQLSTPETSTHSLLTFSKASWASHIPWLPTTLCAEALRDLLRGSAAGSLAFIATSIPGVMVLYSLGTLILQLTYEKAYTNAQSNRSSIRINSKLSYHLSRWLLPGIRSQHRAIITKEFKLFSRDISHTIQLGMLLGICFIYLYNFRALHKPDNLSPDFIEWWQAFLMLGNVALSAMVVASICTRFVFPSISLEGNSFWILQASPITLRAILKTKFRAWFIPLAVIGSVVFISGALALNAEGPLVLATCVGGIILSYGLVGLSIGLGAVFSQFDWEYSAQITTTVGSFTLMFGSVVLLAVDLCPLGLMFVSHLLVPGAEPNGVNWLAIISCLLLLFLINHLVTSVALSLGERSLFPKE